MRSVVNRGWEREQRGVGEECECELVREGMLLEELGRVEVRVEKERGRREVLRSVGFDLEPKRGSSRRRGQIRPPALQAYAFTRLQAHPSRSFLQSHCMASLSFSR